MKPLNQVYANVLNKPILVPQGDVTSLGSAIFAFLAAGAFPSLEAAQKALCPPHQTYLPEPTSVEVYNQLFALYRKLYFSLGSKESATRLHRRCVAATSPHRRQRTSTPMNLKQLREEVLEANLEIVRRGLVLYTFGNASGYDRDSGLVAIKPSGVPYPDLKPEDMVITDVNGKLVEGTLRPSSDLATHLALYRAFDGIGAVVHTHSRYATAWAQAQREIPCLGTTHADYIRGSIPVTKHMQPR